VRYHCISTGSAHRAMYFRVRKVKVHHVEVGREMFYAECDNTAVDTDPLLVSRARLAVVEPALFE
jgi:hypothetical protein